MGRLSDKAIIDLGREYVDIRGRLLAELAARNVSAVERDGVKVARRTNITKTYDIKGLAKQLARGVKAKVIVQRVDGRALAKAVKAGDVDQALVEEMLTGSSESAPFLEVTVKASA